MSMNRCSFLLLGMSLFTLLFYSLKSLSKRKKRPESLYQDPSHRTIKNYLTVTEKSI